MSVRTRNLKLLAAFVTSICLVLPVNAQPVPADFLSTLRANHPRLLLTQDRLSHLKNQAESDALLQRYIEDVIRTADEYLAADPLAYEKVGPRLLQVSRACLRRIYALGLAWRWTGEETYARKAVENLVTVCSFPDWNPSHFLDTAEMSHAVGIGFDWVYDFMDAATRQQVKRGLIELGMEPGVEAYQGEGYWWTRSEFNWNQVCNSGLSIGALAIAESDPEWAEAIVPKAVASLPAALSSYGPDGAWMEGPAYWHYATRYTAYGIAAFQTSLGKDFELTDIDGLADTGLFPIHTTGPTGLYLNFADSGERSERHPMACMFWLARTYQNGLYANAEHAILQNAEADPAHVIWYQPRMDAPDHPGDKDYFFDGPVQVAVFRSGWDDPNGLFVGVKAGYNQVNHGHLDLGNFELDAMGVRWARDLGSDDYNLPGYWESEEGGQRWTYYRLRSGSHNVPLLCGKDQDVYAKSSFTAGNSGRDAFVQIDLTAAYREYADKVLRGITTTHIRHAVVVQDEFQLTSTCDITWGMTTDARITLQENGNAVLRLKNEALVARVLEPEGATFTVTSAEQEPPEARNEGVRRLLLQLPRQSGEVTTAVLLAPVWEDSRVDPNIGVVPLEEW